MSRWLVTVMVAACWLGAASAVPALAVVRVGEFQSAGRFDPGPWLTGDGVVWAEPASSGAAVVRSAQSERGPARTLVRLVGPPESTVDWVDLSASPQAWVAGFTATFYGQFESTTALSEIVGARRGGSATRIASCDRTPGRAEVSLSGLQLASHIDPCRGGPADLEVRDPFESAEPSARLGFTGPFVLAGDRLAMTERDAFVVREWRTGRELLRRVAGRPGYQTSFDLDADGTLAYSYVAGGRSRLEVAGPAGTRRLAAGGRGVGEVRIADGRVAALVSDTAQTVSIVVVDARTGKRRIVARRLLTTRMDFDGRRLTWLEPTCRGMRLAYRPDYKTSAKLTRPTCRNLPLLRGPRLIRNRTVRLQFACSGFTVATCPSRVTIRSRTGHLLGRGRSGELPGDDYATAARIRLTRHGRRFLARRTRARVVIHATLRDRLGRLEHRRATATLRRG
jgi:hypothetical protein